MVQENSASRRATQTIRLKLGDCVDVMQSYPQSSIGAIVCDPPYG